MSKRYKIALKLVNECNYSWDYAWRLAGAILAGSKQ